MQKKMILTALCLTNLNLILANNKLELSPTEQLLFSLYQDKDQAARQDALKIVPAIQSIEEQTAKQADLLEQYKTQNNDLEQVKKDLKRLLNQANQDFQNTLQNSTSNIELANQIINNQQNLLAKYRKANLTKACIITALITSATTALLIKAYVEPKTFGDFIELAKAKLPTFPLAKK